MATSNRVTPYKIPITDPRIAALVAEAQVIRTAIVSITRILTATTEATPDGAIALWSRFRAEIKAAEAKMASHVNTLTAAAPGEKGRAKRGADNYGDTNVDALPVHSTRLYKAAQFHGNAAIAMNFAVAKAGTSKPLQVMGQTLKLLNGYEQVLLDDLNARVKSAIDDETRRTGKPVPAGEVRFHLTLDESDPSAILVEQEP